MRLANWLNTELRLPKAAEDELEGQFVRSVSKLCGDLNSKVKEMKKVCRYIAEVPFDPPMADDTELRDAFRKRSKDLKDYYKVVTIPNTKAPAELFLEMAINRRAPFEEILVKDRSVVAGFQDAVILQSIIEDAETLSTDERGAIVSNDGIFHSPEVRAILKTNRVELEIFKSGDALFTELWEYVWGAVRDAWDNENKEVESSLNRNKEGLTQQIIALLPISEVGRSSWKTAKEIKSLRIRNFYLVRAELPESQYHPPSASEYKRPENSRVQISARVTVEVEAVVETV